MFQYDTKHNRMFLRRAKCDTVTADDLYVGALVNVFSRQMKIVGYGDEFTNLHLGVVKQR